MPIRTAPGMPIRCGIHSAHPNNKFAFSGITKLGNGSLWLVVTDLLVTCLQW